MNELTTKSIRDSISKAFDKSPKLERIYKRIRDGTATYEDAHKFAIELSNIMCRELWNYSHELNGDEMSGYLLEELLTKHGRLTNAVCESIQLTLNDSAGLGLNAVTPPIDADRVAGIVTAMGNAEETEEVFKTIEEPFKTCALSHVDAWVKSNADFQKRAGLNPVIVRKFEGAHYDAKSKKMRICKFCSDLAGVFDYDEAPKDVYVRHLGCRCNVLYYPDKDSMGRITALAKGSRDESKDLWNTGAEWSESRQAVLRRRRKQLGKAEARKILNEEWVGGRNGLAERHFT